jgi:RNA polymerase sigma factor (sigma-70 family)
MILPPWRRNLQPIDRERCRVVRMSDRYSKEFFEHMVSMHWQSVWAFVYSLLGDAHLAGDISQDTFIIAATRIHQLRDLTRLKPWLFTIARHRCTDLLRSGWSTKVVSMGDDFGGVAGMAMENVEEETMSRIQRHTLWNAILGLKQGFREVMVLRVREELSFRDIAKVLKIREGTARSRYIRAVEQLRSEMVKGGDGHAL